MATSLRARPGSVLAGSSTGRSHHRNNSYARSSSSSAAGSSRVTVSASAFGGRRRAAAVAPRRDPGMGMVRDPGIFAPPPHAHALSSRARKSSSS